MTAPAPAPLELRPRSASEILDASIQLFRSNAGALIVISAVASVPLLVVSVINAITVMPKLAAGPAAFSARDLLSMYPYIFVSYLWFLVVDGAAVLVAAESYQGRTIATGKALGRAFSRAGPILVGSIAKYLLIFLLMFVGIFATGMLMGILAALFGGRSMLQAFSSGSPAAMMVTLLIGAVAIAVGFVFAALPLARYFGNLPAVMLENESAMGSLSRSSTLAAGSYRKIIGVMLSIYLVYFVVYFAIYMLLRVATNSAWVSQMLAGLVRVLLTPIVSVTLTVLYFDLRMRREGYDLQLLADEMQRVDRGEATSRA